MRSRGVNAWRMLRERDHLVLRFADLDPRCGGGELHEHPDGRRFVFLDHRLDRRTRHAVLLHELLHDEHDALFPPGTPQAVVDVVERWIQRQVVALLVPPDELREFVRRRADVGPVTAGCVADEFEVPAEVALDAMRLLR